jgi:DNA (cytosine-5)-methyltransferase 1
LPQNRERFFLLGLRKDLAKTFTFPEQQTDFIPKLSSILETDVDEKYYIDDLKAAKIIEQANGTNWTTSCGYYRFFTGEKRR